jgi:hypothetical protein
MLMADKGLDGDKGAFFWTMEQLESNPFHDESDFYSRWRE